MILYCFVEKSDAISYYIISIFFFMRCSSLGYYIGLLKNANSNLGYYFDLFVRCNILVYYINFVVNR